MQPAELQGARQSAIPASLAPMLATPIEQPFSNPQWLFEIKWDGVRALAWMDKHNIKLRSRAQNDVTTQ
jgi:bifunctional non-homologous end joining protein LigD